MVRPCSGGKNGIEVSYQLKQDAKDPHTQFTSTGDFECDEIPNRDAVISRKGQKTGKLFWSLWIWSYSDV